jgi:hypothetical protein
MAERKHSNNLGIYMNGPGDGFDICWADIKAEGYKYNAVG